jgi:glycosyltransferase involved in cell wall biosynthesis
VSLGFAYRQRTVRLVTIQRVVLQQRILINANFYGVGGREIHVVKLCEALVQTGVEVTVVSRIANSSAKQITDSLKAVPVRFLSTPFASSSNLKLSTIWAMMVWPLQLRRHSFHALYTFDLSSFTEFLRKFVSSDGKVILNRAGDLMRVEDLPAMNLTLPDLMMVETELQAAAARDMFRSNLPIISIPLLGNYHSPPSRTETPGKECLEAAFLGRFDENKGAFRLLKVWSKLRDQRLRLSFYGHGDRDRLQEAICSLGLTDRVAIKESWTSSKGLAKILDQTDFVVLASQTEGLPIVLLESIAHGVPFVATDVGAIRTLAEGNPDVLVVENELEAIAAGIDKMASLIRSGSVIGKRLQQFALERYNYELLAADWRQALLNPGSERLQVPVEDNVKAQVVMQ